MKRESKLHFTSQEERVLEAAADGLTDKEAAARMGLSVRTVHTYWTRMRERVEMTRCQLVMVFGRREMLSITDRLRVEIARLKRRLREARKARPGRWLRMKAQRSKPGPTEEVA